jgi:hypothetical protein
VRRSRRRGLRCIELDLGHGGERVVGGLREDGRFACGCHRALGVQLPAQRQQLSSRTSR